MGVENYILRWCTYDTLYDTLSGWDLDNNSVQDLINLVKFQYDLANLLEEHGHESESDELLRDLEEFNGQSLLDFAE
jgi:hypothetical protein